MVYFLVKKEDEMLRNYDPTTADDSLRTTIVAKLEHYGAELMKILDEGKDAGMGPEKQECGASAMPHSVCEHFQSCRRRKLSSMNPHP